MEKRGLTRALALAALALMLVSVPLWIGQLGVNGSLRGLATLFALVGATFAAVGAAANVGQRDTPAVANFDSRTQAVLFYSALGVTSAGLSGIALMLRGHVFLPGNTQLVASAAVASVGVAIFVIYDRLH